MTSQYISVIEEQLETKFPQHQEQQTLTLQNIRFKLFLPKTTLMLNQYQNLRTLNINHCDLRNLDNFPKIYTLEQLDLGYNQLQGTFNNLMPLKKLKYLNVEHNLIFQSNKLAPLRKIASISSNTQQKNQTKICICIKNNPFIQEDTPYLIKFKNYGLKVIKQPKEYFDKKKQDQQKLTKNKSSAKKGKKNQLSATKSNKNSKRNWFQQSSNEESSLVSHQSPILRVENNNSSSNMNNNNVNNPVSNVDRRPITYEDRMQYLRVSRNNIVDNYGGQPGRLLVRLGTSRADRGQMVNLDENPFVDFDMMDDEDEMNHLRGMFQFEDQDSDSDENQEQDRFGNAQPINNSNSQAAIQQRIRLIERRNARMQQMREIQRQNRLQRQRLRLERRQLQRQSQLIRRRQVNRMSFQRRREERCSLLRRQQQRELLRQQQRELIRRLSSSSNSRNPFIEALPNSLGNRLSSNASDSSNPLQSSIYAISGGLRRSMDYREELQRRILDSQGNVDNNVSNDSSNRPIGSILPPLRVRPSSNDPNSNIIHLQRASSIPNNQNQTLFSNDNQPMRVFNDGDMDSYSDQDDNENNQQDIQDRDDSNEDEDQGMHICDIDCQCDQFQRQEEQEEDEQNQDPNIQQVLPLQPINDNVVVDYEDSGIQLFINNIVDGNLIQNIDDSEQSEDQYEFIINEDGDQQVRRNNNQASNLSSKPGNPQPESQNQQDNDEDQSSSQ